MYVVDPEDYMPTKFRQHLVQYASMASFPKSCWPSVKDIRRLIWKPAQKCTDDCFCFIPVFLRVLIPQAVSFSAVICYASPSV